MIKNRIERSQGGGWLTRVSKQIFMKERKKKAVISAKTSPQRKSLEIPKLYWLR